MLGGGDEGSCRHQLHLSMFNEFCRCRLQQWGFAVSGLWRATYCLGNSLGSLRVPMGPLWTTIQLDVTQSCYWKLHSVTRDGQLELCLPYYFIFHLGCFRVCIYYRASTVLGWPLILVASPRVSSLIPFSPPCPHLILVSASPPFIRNYLFCFTFLMRIIR